MTTQKQREMARFAFTTYVGELLTSPEPTISKQESELLSLAMPAVGLGDWEVVWGPMLYRFSHTLTRLYDNFMLVARKGTEYVIAIRGTNGGAKLDWLFEDFWVIPQFPWGDFVGREMPAGTDPKIADGTHLGCQQLLSTEIAEGLPGQKTNLLGFLTSELSGRESVTLNVAGHSLGGALAPTLALYLKDTQGRSGGWDPDLSADIWSYALAGPTAGNGDFAKYTDRLMGTQALRIVNPLDVVPLSWSHNGLEKLKHVYDSIQHPVKLSIAERLAVDAVIGVLELGGLDYEQYHQGGPGLVLLDAISDYDAASFMAQAGWQHTVGYETDLGLGDIRGILDSLFVKWCGTQPPGTCPD